MKMHDDSIRLQRCPFCGFPACIVDNGDGRYYVRCSKCKARLGGPWERNKPADLVEWWNKRIRNARFLALFLACQKHWSLTTFGDGRRTVGIIEHIKSEFEEIEQAPDDLTEWIDVVLLALDACWRVGASPEEIINALVEKQMHNMTKRDWKQTPEDQPSFHLKGDSDE